MEKKIIDFLSEIEKVKSTLRHNWTRTGRQESSAEHSWRSAIFLSLIQDVYKFDIDTAKALKMMLIHDIPELIDGDIPGFQQAGTNKKEKEQLNAQKIFGMLPPPLNKEYLELFEEFEAGESPEAKLLHALEKIETQLQHLDSGPQYWCEEESGDHMLNYPQKVLDRLNDERINNIWESIKAEIKKIS